MTRSTLRRRATLTVLVVLAAPALTLGSQSGAAAAPAKTVTASNTSGVAIADAGPANPYPASIKVPAHRGVITDVDVTLDGLVHRCMDSLEILLVGPSGIRARLLGRAGGCHGQEDGPLTLVLDDEATDPVPTYSTIESGPYQPTDSVPDGSASPTAPASLLVFDGAPASGTWSLFIFDAKAGDAGILAGWSIEIDYNDPVAPAGTVSVDSGAAQTSTPTTTLTLSAADPSPGTGVTQMRFSNDGTTWSAFQPYAPTASWSLSAADGTKTVWAQYADDFGNLSAPVSDTIHLTTTAPPTPTTPVVPTTPAVPTTPTIPADSTAPTATKLSPKNLKANRSVATTVSFVASEALDAATVTRRNVRLTARGTTLHAKVSYAADTRKVTVTPQKKLAVHTTYKVKISPRVTDLAGNGFVRPTWSFRTR